MHITWSVRANHVGAVRLRLITDGVVTKVVELASAKAATGRGPIPIPYVGKVTFRFMQRKAFYSRLPSGQVGDHSV